MRQLYVFILCLLFLPVSVFSQDRPARPLLDRPVHLLEKGQAVTPVIPSNRLSTDGRISIDFTSVEQVEFTLLKPELLDAPFERSEPGYQIIGGTEVNNILEPEAPFNVDRDLFHSSSNTTFGGASHHTLCETTPLLDDALLAQSNINRNPQACADDPLADCYQFTMIGTHFGTDVTSGHIRLWGTPFEVKVKSPKTRWAYIDKIEVGTPVLGALIELPSNSQTTIAKDRWFEPITTADGKLLLGRNNGGTKLLYSVAPANSNGCDVTQWTTAHELTHAYHDPDMYVSGVAYDGPARYGIAQYQMRDSIGSLIPDGFDSRSTYPWMDKLGNNVMSTATHDLAWYNQNGSLRFRYPISCAVAGSGCNVPNNVNRIRKDHRSLRGTVMIGSWTRGKYLYIDNMVNHTDYMLAWYDSSHYNIRLYEGTGSSSNVRIGSSYEQLQGLSHKGHRPLLSMYPYIYVLDSTEGAFKRYS